MTVAQALDGLNGWHRWGVWAAHYFVDGKQLCNTHHMNFKTLGVDPRRPNRVTDLSPGGIPYGRVCIRCQKLARKVKP